MVAAVTAEEPRVRCVRNEAPHGFGFAVRKGLEAFANDAVVIVMADGSDDPRDVVLYYRVLEAGYDCAFGSRFMPGAVVRDYPRIKLTINRVVNTGIRMLFRHGYNDTTNAFKAYRREVIENMRPLLSHHFNLTVELPLKAITRGFSYAIVPTSWTNRAAGTSKLQLNEMGSRYLFIVLYVFLEDHLSRGDYRRAGAVGRRAPGRAHAPAGHGARSREPAAAPPPRAPAEMPHISPKTPAPAQPPRLASSRSPRSRGGSPTRTRRSSRSSAGGWAWLLVAVGVYGVALAVRGFRWHRILRLIDIPHKRADAYRLVLVGYMGNNVLPVRGGEILRIGLLGARTTARRREILSSVVAERMLDAAVLAALFAVLTWFNVADAPAGQTPAAIAAVALVLGAVALAAYLALRRRGFFHAFHEKVGPFLKAMKLFAHVEGVLLAALTVVAWCCEGLTLLLIGKSLGLELHLLDTLSIIVLASLFAAIPAAPGYAGTFDAGIVLGLKAVGVTGGAAVGFVVLARFAMFVPVTLVGLFFLLHTYGGFRRARAGARRSPRRRRRSRSSGSPPAARKPVPDEAVSARG